MSIAKQVPTKAMEKETRVYLVNKTDGNSNDHDNFIGCWGPKSACCCNTQCRIGKIRVRPGYFSVHCLGYGCPVHQNMEREGRASMVVT